MTPFTAFFLGFLASAALWIHIEATRARDTSANLYFYARGVVEGATRADGSVDRAALQRLQQEMWGLRLEDFRAERRTDFTPFTDLMAE